MLGRLTIAVRRWQARRRASRRRGERGIALIMVLLMIALVGSVVAEFQFTSRIDLQLALNARDEVQAEYNALSALRMRAMILKQSQKLKALGSTLGPLLGMEGPLPITQILEMIPIECGLMSAVMRKAADPFLDDEELAAETEAEGDYTGGLFTGECIATANSEHSKIGISAALGSHGKRAEVMTMLAGILMDPRLERHFEEDDRNGDHAESPEELIGAIVDWMDINRSQEINPVADEGRYYDFMDDAYEIKNAPFDSIAELQLVHGIDDELYELLRDNVSIYNDSTQMELATTPTDRIIFFGIPACLREGVSSDVFFGEFAPGQIPLIMLYLKIEEVRMLGPLGMTMLSPQVLAAWITEVGLAPWVDPTKVAQVFTNQPKTTWYTIEAQGRAGNASRRIRAVFQAQEGQFYYMRIE